MCVPAVASSGAFLQLVQTSCPPRRPGNPGLLPSAFVTFVVTTTMQETVHESELPLHPQRC